MRPAARPPERFSRSGYTLLEVIVVLVLLAVAAAVVAPSFFTARPEQFSTVPMLVSQVRAASVRRGVAVRLTINRSGEWRATAGSGRELLTAGRIPAPAAAVDLIISPLGTCGIAAGGNPEALAAYDFLTCEEMPL